jgi:hypothetical protein
MIKKFFYPALLGICLVFSPWQEQLAAQELVEAQDFITTLKELIATTTKNIENPLGRLTKVEMEVGVMYTKDSEGKLKIFAIPYNASFANTTAHKLTLHWLPHTQGQGNIPIPGAMSTPMPFPGMSPGLTPQQQEAIKDLVRERVKRRSEEGKEEKKSEEQKAP